MTMVWQAIEENDPSLLYSTTEIAGLQMHVIAFAVRWDEAAGMQVVDSEEGRHEDAFDLYCAADEPDGPYSTVKLEGFDRDYVLFATPFCD